MTKNNFFLAFNLNLISVRFYSDERRIKVLFLCGFLKNQMSTNIQSPISLTSSDLWVIIKVKIERRNFYATGDYHGSSRKGFS